MPFAEELRAFVRERGGLNAVLAPTHRALMLGITAVNAVAFRPLRVGITQSKRSIPDATPTSKSSGRPTPIK